ncbi:hypothetical protein [Streptomyces nojiriensis]|uniref:hypothetical protein n=1 Tax=Streptomyces nojiriensis TaxID=66374 RepID=UPI00167A7EE4|nr:hypothetical protein [Streptomyces nojiriensis]
MIEANGDRDTRRRDEVAYVCGRLDRIRADLEAHGADGAAPLEDLAAALRAGTDPTARLDALHEALLAAGDAAGVGGGARGLDPIGTSAPVPDAWVLLCPTGQCSRYSWPDGPEAPRCSIGDEPLRRERL